MVLESHGNLLCAEIVSCWVEWLVENLPHVGKTDLSSGMLVMLIRTSLKLLKSVLRNFQG